MPKPKLEWTRRGGWVLSCDPDTTPLELQDIIEKARADHHAKLKGIDRGSVKYWSMAARDLVSGRVKVKPFGEHEAIHRMKYRTQTERWAEVKRPPKKNEVEVELIQAEGDDDT